MAQATNAPAQAIFAVGWNLGAGFFVLWLRTGGDPDGSRPEHHLLRTAVLLAGNREAGEDLLQTAVERLLRRWGRIDGDPEGYVRRTLCNLAIDGYRRAGRWRQKERLLRTELRQPQDETGDVDLRDALVRLLVQLPARQRAVLVLRYWEQLTDAEAAAVLGCSEGTVKSSGSRGLARLRELADGWNDTAAMCGRNGKRS